MSWLNSNLLEAMETENKCCILPQFFCICRQSFRAFLFAIIWKKEWDIKWKEQEAGKGTKHKRWKLDRRIFGQFSYVWKFSPERNKAKGSYTPIGASWRLRKDIRQGIMPSIILMLCMGLQIAYMAIFKKMAKEWRELDWKWEAKYWKGRNKGTGLNKEAIREDG